jgi:hypothetical protein
MNNSNDTDRENEYLIKIVLTFLFIFLFNTVADQCANSKNREPKFNVPKNINKIDSLKPSSNSLSATIILNKYLL